MTGLVLETLWVRLMVLVFGSTTFAVSTVLTAFMGGLALGSWIAGARAERLADPRGALAAYGVLELCIGLYALALPLGIAQLPLVHSALWGTSHHSYHTFALLRFLLAGALLLIPTMAMGATLPVLARYTCALDRDSGSVGRRVGTLYAVNTAGAVAGVFLAGFVLLPTLGARATNLCACLADLLLALLALALWRREGRAGEARAARAAPAPLPAAAGETTGRRLEARLALASIAVSGAIAMVYQVGWTRALSLIIGSSTYAFSLILVCFLLGLAGGAAVYARRQAHQPDQAGNLGVIHLLTAVTALAGVQVMDRLPALLLVLMRQVELAPRAIFAIKFAVAGTIILLPTFFMGMVFPAVIQLVASGRDGAARTTGRVYAFNTLGAIVGSFAGGFLLVPLLGLQRSLATMVLGSLLLAGLFGLLAARVRGRALTLAAVVCVAAVMLALARPWELELITSGVFRVSRYQEVAAGSRPAAAQQVDRLAGWREWARGVLPPAAAVDSMAEPSAGYGIVFHQEGVTTTVTMSRSVDRSIARRACWVRHSLLVNGKPDASLTVLRARPRRGCRGLLTGRLTGPGLAVSAGGDAETQVLSGILPLALHGGPASRPLEVMVIGWGSGITAGAALQGPVASLVAVELEREVIEAARHFEPHNHAPQRDGRLRLVNEDGRNFLAATRQRFDVVISEPSNPWIAGCGNLFTREFFGLVKGRLRPRGIFLQWLQTYEIAPRNVWSILGTLSDVFPSVHAFRPARAGSDLLLVARRDPAPPRWRDLARRLRHAGIRGELARVGIVSPTDLAARLLAAPEGIRRVTAGAPRNTDDNARIEFAAPRDLINYRRYSPTEITRRLEETLESPLRAFSGAPAAEAAGLCWARLRAGQLDRSRACAGVAGILGAPDPPLRLTELRRLAAGRPRLAGIAELVSLPPAEALARAGRILPPAPEPAPDPAPAPGIRGDPALDPGMDPGAAPDPALDPPPDPPPDPGMDPGMDPRGSAYVVSALLGHLNARAGNHHSALLFLTTAVELEGKGGPRYPPLRGLLARQLLRVGDGPRAVLAARAAERNTAGMNR